MPSVSSHIKFASIRSPALTIPVYSHPSCFITRSRADDSTSNLNKHIDACDPTTTGETEAISAYVHGNTYSAARMRYLLAKWTTRRFRPFIIVEDPELIEIFQMLFARIQIPSANTVSSDVREIFAVAQSSVKKLLQVSCVFFIVP